MSDSAELDLSGLTSDFPAPGGTEAPPAAEAPAGTEPDAGGEAPSEPAEQNVAQGSQSDDGPLDLAKLQALADKRKAARPEQKPEPEKEAPPPLTAEAIAQAMQSGDSFQQQVRAAWAKGDMESLSKLMAQDGKGDAARDFERFTQNALNPDAARVTDEVAALKAKIAELEGKELPGNVLTEEKLQQMQQEQAYAANRQAYLASFSDAEKYPTLSKVDNEDFRLQCGHEAQQAIEAAGHEPTTELLAQIAEQVASSKLAGLLGQNRGPAPKTEGGSELPKAAGDAATGAKTEGTGEIDNRAASTTAATMPDPDDEDAWERRLTSIAAGSRAP